MNELPDSGVLALHIKPGLESKNQVSKPRRFLLRLIWWLPLALAGVFTGFSVLVLLFPQRMLTVESGPVKADVLILLGGTINGRPERTAELFREGVAPLVLITGRGDAPHYAEILERLGVPPSAILLECKAKSTYENALFCAPILRKIGAKKVIVVTSWFHSRRALACFEHVCPNLMIYSRPAYADYDYMHWGPVRTELRIGFEYSKTIYYAAVYGVWSYWM